ncbi:MAG: hypothetical protein ACAH83_16090 [Alphaproteobacteria bacterium]
MFNFKSKKLNPVTGNLVSQFEKAGQLAQPTEKVEALMNLRKDAGDQLAAITKSETRSAFWGIAVLLVSQFMPVAAIAVGMFWAGAAWAGKKFMNMNRSEKDRETLKEKIDTAVSGIVENNLQDALASPAFVKSLKASFKSATEHTNAAFDDIVKRTRPAPAKASAPTA